MGQMERIQYHCQRDREIGAMRELMSEQAEQIQHCKNSLTAANVPPPEPPGDPSSSSLHHSTLHGGGTSTSSSFRRQNDRNPAEIFRQGLEPRVINSDISPRSSPKPRKPSSFAKYLKPDGSPKMPSGALAGVPLAGSSLTSSKYPLLRFLPGGPRPGPMEKRACSRVLLLCQLFSLV